MPSFEFHYIVTYENGKIRSPGNRSIMRVELSDEEYVKIAVGLSEGKELMEIPDIEDVLERMKQRVVEYDVYYSLDGRLKSKPSTRQRKDIGTMHLYNIDTLHNIFLTVHGTFTRTRFSLMLRQKRMNLRKCLMRR